METIATILIEFVVMVIVGICVLCAVAVIAACVIGGRSDAHQDE